ncbi:MAG: discoidin domain-containing protein [Fluviicoccus sp.]|uniref:galactose-binding domain-containing protein n=1 Tax=Fluviicoccus sp. TaxID=2003552 RepID=UPI00271C7295|nr:discoidin domain-containing protein [Fluviicoccus sp.]MDO8331134.1 discoidin domain-containing protein [Fluviicoccus sp.]
MWLPQRTRVLILSALLPSVVSSSELPYQIAGPTGPASGAYPNLPDVPAIFRNVTGIIEGEFSRPILPPLRLTRDGRLGVHSQAFDHVPALALLRPETVKTPFINSARGATPLVDANNPYLKLDLAKLGAPDGFQHVTLCESDPEEKGQRANPYACGLSGADDCYDVTLVGGINEKSLLSIPEPTNNGTNPSSSVETLLSAPLTVRVSNPKTSWAKIEEVTVRGEGIRRNDKMLSAQFEHITPADGRLLVVRLGGQKLTWFNENTGAYQTTDSVDTAYSVAPKSANACDAGNWKKFYPISHAPYHATMRERYKFAAYPFRDPKGNLIPDGADIKGTYPWIDHQARVLALSVFNSRLNDHSGKSRFPTRCVVDGCTAADRKDVTDSVHDIGIVLTGLWTRGKMVVLDGVINDIDFKLGQQDRQHSYAQLYAPNTGRLGNETGEVRMGSTRGVGSYNTPVGSANNGSIFDSMEERLNYLPNLRTVSPHDVSWLASTGRQTDEISFDDYLRPNGFIVSEMTGALDFDAGNSHQMLYHDGWDLNTLSFSAPVYMQNSATTLPEEWHIPTHGQVIGGRLEPAALGGLRGKGLWLNGNGARLIYEIKRQPRNIDAFPWYMGLNIEPRLAGGGEVTLIRFPDNTSVNLLNRQSVVYRNARGEGLNSIQLPFPLANKAWAHLGIQVFPGGRRVQFLLNGFVLNEWTGASSAPGLFRLLPGQLVVGAPATAQQGAFQGWIDDFKIFSEHFNAEESCNMASGTLIGLPSQYTGVWRGKAGAYPASSHAAVSRTLQMHGKQTYPQYACYTDYSADYAAHKYNLPAGSSSIREAIIFPEGPLYHDAPRPDSVYNPFCLGCHTAGGEGGLGLNALKFRDIPGKLDPRRQPSQPPALVWGNFPASWLANAPAWPFKTGEGGLLIDELLLPSASGQKAEVKALVLVDARTGRDIMPLTNGMVLNLSALETDQVNIRASSTGLTRRVTFVHNGASSYQEPPFALFGTNNSTPEADFAAGTLAAGPHTLSAKSLNGSELVNVTFTVTGSSANVSIPGKTVYTEILHEQRNLLSAFVQEARDFFGSIADFFNRIGSYIAAQFDSLLAKPQTVALGNTTPAFNTAGNDLQLFVDFSVLDKDRGIVEMRGRAYGSHGNTLFVNGSAVPVADNKWTWRGNNLAVKEYALSVRNANQAEEKTWVSFNEAKVPAGIVVRQDARALSARLASTVDLQQIADELAANAGINIYSNNQGSLKIKSIKLDRLSLTGSTRSLPDSAVNAVIPTVLNAPRITINAEMTIKGDCLVWPVCWGTQVFNNDIVFNNTRANVDFALKAPPADKNQVFAVGVNVALDPNSFSLIDNSDINPWTVVGQIRLKIREAAFNWLINERVSKALETQANKLAAKVTEDSLFSPGFNTPMDTWAADNIGKFMPLLPDGLFETFKAFQAAGLSLQMRVTDARTKNNDLLLAVDAVAKNSTLDGRVFYGQRLTDAERVKALQQTAGTVFNARGDTDYLHLNGRFSGSLLAALTQSNIFNESTMLDLTKLIDLKAVKDAVQSGAVGNDPGSRQALNALLANPIASVSASGQNTGLNAQLRVAIADAPYQLDSGNMNVNRVRIDDVALTLESIPTSRARIEGLKPATLMSARLGVILNVSGNSVAIEAIRLHELNSPGLVMTPAASNAFVRALLNRALSDRAPRGFLLVKRQGTNLLAPSRINVALNKPAFQSSIAWGGDASRAVDGNTDGNYWSNSTTHTNADASNFWGVNLQGTYEVTGVTIHNRKDCCTERLANFTVELFYQGKRQAILNHPSGLAGSSVNIDIKAYNVDQVRVWGVPGTYLSLAEVEVWGR